MSDLFSIYEYNLNLVITKLSKIIENLPSTQRGIYLLTKDKYDSLVGDGELTLKEAEGIVYSV